MLRGLGSLASIANHNVVFSSSSYALSGPVFPDLPFPAFFAKRQGWPKKGKEKGPKRKEINKSLSFWVVSLHFRPKSLHFVFWKGHFNSQKDKDLKCKDFNQNARIFCFVAEGASRVTQRDEKEQTTR